MHAPTDTCPGPAAFVLHAASPDATDAVGRALAPVLAASDVIALKGPLGAGKSHLARALIRARLGQPDAEVPSPTYTLVNVYTAQGVEIWHADLYRVGPEDTAEIGLSEAAEHAILLIEWPDRWPDLPARRLDLTLAPVGEGRDIAVAAHGPDWDGALLALHRLQ